MQESKGKRREDGEEESKKRLYFVCFALILPFSSLFVLLYFRVLSGASILTCKLLFDAFFLSNFVRRKAMVAPMHGNIQLTYIILFSKFNLNSHSIQYYSLLLQLNHTQINTSFFCCIIVYKVQKTRVKVICSNLFAAFLFMLFDIKIDCQ